MKKILSLILIIIFMLSSLFLLSGCNKSGDSNQVENKNVEKYEVESKYGKLYFEMPKDTGYELKTDTNKAILTHNENKSTIEIYIMNTIKSSIIMKEKDFSSSAYSDYKEIEITGHKAYTIKKTNNFAVQYGILLDEYDKEHNKNYGVKIVVSKNSLKLEEFDPSAFVESDAFKTLLNSLKFEGYTSNEDKTNNNETNNID